MVQLRLRDIQVPLAEQATLPQKAVQAAADLLGIVGYKPDDQRSNVGTNNPQAYAAFQAAESFRAQDNDAGLNDAIEKYQQAISIDPQYAVAQTTRSRGLTCVPTDYTATPAPLPSCVSIATAKSIPTGRCARRPSIDRRMAKPKPPHRHLNKAHSLSPPSLTR